MHVETLKTFCDLVETGSLSRAARLNLVSQSAVSQQLRALERRYGRRLIERSPRIGARPARGSLAVLDGQPFIGFDRDIPTRRLVDSLLRRHRVRVSYAMELDNIETIKRTVEAGLGLSLLPAPTLVAEIRSRTLVARPPVEGPFRRPIGVMYRRTRELSAAGQAFLALLTAELGTRAGTPKG